MRTTTALLATGITLALLTACGRGRDDTLADGATDRASAQGPQPAGVAGGPPAAAASPGVGNDTDASASPNTTVAAGATLVGAPGAPITNAAGLSTYALDGDRDGSKCTGDCLHTWPPVLAVGVQPNGGPGLEGAKIATITRGDGSMQVTYDGHPLYHYAADGGAGKTSGDGVKDKYGTWHLMKAPPTPASAASSSGGTVSTPAPSSSSTAPTQTPSR